MPTDPTSDGAPPTRGVEKGNQRTGMPRWVKIFLIIAAVLVVTFVVVHLAGGGFGNHLPAGNSH